MSLTIERLLLEDFRNYRSFHLDGIGSTTILVGPNAVGKTNVVEAVQLLTSQASFRNPTCDQLIRMGARAARCEASARDARRELSIRLSVSDGKKRWSLNGKSKRPSDLSGLVPSVAFTPDDLELAKGSQSVRRRAVDLAGSQLSKNHYLIRRDFEKVLRQKNSLLKEGSDPVLLASLNELFVTVGAQLTCYRAALVSRMARWMSEFYRDIAASSEHLEVKFAPSWLADGSWLEEGQQLGRDDARSSLNAALDARVRDEALRRRCLVGPQADRIGFFISGAPVETYGSQGQQRSCVLSFKLAEVELVQSVLGQRPVLLLDDVMSELDESRRRSLMTFVSGEVQTFITTANLAYFDSGILARSDVVELPLRSA